MESQVWHFLNWGGRCVTHGILQLTLMCGELGADMLNMIATLVLGWMVCVMVGWRKPFCFLCASSLIVALNANVKMSMFWQAGTVNYVYSTVWILAFLWPYLRQTEEPEADDLPLVNLWIWPLGLMAGWSNENMGPASLVTALAAVGYLVKGKKRRLKAWMAGGPAACLLGSILVVAAPATSSGPRLWRNCLWALSCMNGCSPCCGRGRTICSRRPFCWRRCFSSGRCA